MTSPFHPKADSKDMHLQKKSPQAAVVQKPLQEADLVEWARRTAKRDREAIFLVCPVSWPAMMVREMDSGYCDENGLCGTAVAAKSQSAETYTRV
jgi:hypothetical protein